MARPTKFSPDRGHNVIDQILSGVSRRQAAEASGVSLRTLAYWLAKGSAGDPSLAEWVRQFKEAERTSNLLRRSLRRTRVEEDPQERWQRFKAQRIAWHLDRLGPVEFWRRRLNWLAEKGHTEAYEQTVASLRAEGYCIFPPL